MVNVNSLEGDGLRQAELCPRNTMMMNFYSFSLNFALKPCCFIQIRYKYMYEIVEETFVIFILG